MRSRAQQERDALQMTTALGERVIQLYFRKYFRHWEAKNNNKPNKNPLVITGETKSLSIRSPEVTLLSGLSKLGAKRGILNCLQRSPPARRLAPRLQSRSGTGRITSCSILNRAL